MPKAYLVYNPFAGRFSSSPLVERPANALRETGWDIQLILAESGAQITSSAKQAAYEGADGFFVMGGDGSINLALAGLIGSETALGVLPAGTGNVFAQELGLPTLNWLHLSAPEEAAKMLSNAEVHKIDVGICNGKPFLLWAGVGLDAQIVHSIYPHARWEKFFATAYYAMSAAKAASSFHGLDLRVEVEGEQISGRYLLAIGSNIRLYAGGLASLSPEAQLDDGYMDLWLFEGSVVYDTLQRAVDLLAGWHTTSEHVLNYRYRHLSLISDSPLFFQLDGEPMQEGSIVTIDVRQRVLPVMVPRDRSIPLSSDGHQG
jgi:diacylglycerol kinase (ATP)